MAKPIHWRGGVSISQPHHWPVVLFAPTRESGRFQGIRPPSVYIKDQAPWAISVSNCIYDTYESWRNLDSLRRFPKSTCPVRTHHVSYLLNNLARYLGGR